MKTKIDIVGYLFDSKINNVLTAIENAGGVPYIVGGAARDLVCTGHNPRDLDIEVFNISPISLLRILSTFGKVDEVGKSYGVFILPDIKYNGTAVEFSTPRTEETFGDQHQDISVDLNPYMTFEKASRRRDLTINAMGIEWPSGKIEDPHGGQQDYKRHLAREVDPSTFGDDHLRTLRAAQFIARFGLWPTESLIYVAQATNLEFLSEERIHEEWKKLLMKGTCVSQGIRFLAQVGWINQYYPYLGQLMWVKQDRKWHPEGDVFTHTMEVVDKASQFVHQEHKGKLVHRQSQQGPVWDHILEVVDEASQYRRRNTLSDEWSEALMYAALCHDCGKISTTFFGKKDDKIHSYGHESSHEVVPALEALTKETRLFDNALWLIRNHMRRIGLQTGGIRAYRKFVREAPSKEAIEALMIHFICDGKELDRWGEEGDCRLKMEEAIDHVYAYQSPDGRARIPITGKDIIEALGLNGKEIGKAMKIATTIFDNNPCPKDELLVQLKEELDNEE